MDAVLCRKQKTPDYIISISIFAFIYMNCTGKMVRIARRRLGILSMVKLKKKSLSRGSFRTHGRVIGNKNFFIFGLISDILLTFKFATSWCLL